MRGKLASAVIAIICTRLIPAHAGKTDSGSARPRPRWAHPRACGENRAVRIHRVSEWGSSPRMRGKHGAHQYVIATHGLIPAHAGKTKRSHVAVEQQRAHPRACGENVKAICGRKSQEGSSPRMRGKLPTGLRVRRGGRLIPAHAGKTREAIFERGYPRAHPRACGENRIQNNALDIVLGSSPRMRGKPIASGMV